jgi:cell wall-associated NlpC family hydrolase
MDPKALAGIAGATLVLVIGSAAGLGLAGGGLAVAACTQPPAPTPSATARGGSSTAAPTATEPAASWRPVGAWAGQQVANAATIVAVGQRLSVPPRGWVIAVATAMQESRLTNLTGGDRDSLGLFQQRPSAGWGDTPTGQGDHRTPTQRILDPAYAATRFYTALTAVSGWQNLPLTVAAQAVQRSGFPDGYAKQEPDALALVEAVGPTLAELPAREYAQWVSMCVALGGDGRPAGTPAALPAGFTLPSGTPPAVRAAIGWALAQLGTPYSYGGDCTDPHGPDPAHHCDCSSLTQMAWKAGGITIPRTAAEQSRIGTPVPNLAQLRPGDLVFIPGADGTATAPGHVAMFVGAGLVVEAPHTGDRVKLVPLQPWAPMITQLRRVVT